MNVKVARSQIPLKETGLEAVHLIHINAFLGVLGQYMDFTSLIILSAFS